MADENLPIALRRRGEHESIQDDLEPYRGTDVEERSAILGELCRHSIEIINNHPNGARILDHQDRHSPESEALWLRIVARARRS